MPPNFSFLCRDDSDDTKRCICCEITVIKVEFFLYSTTCLNCISVKWMYYPEAWNIKQLLPHIFYCKIKAFEFYNQIGKNNGVFPLENALFNQTV